MTVRQLHTVDGYYGVSGDGFNPKGALIADDKELDEETYVFVAIESWIPPTCFVSFPLSQFSQIGKQEGRWTAIGDPTDSACASPLDGN